MINFNDPKETSRWFNNSFRYNGGSGLMSDATMTDNYIAQARVIVSEFLDYIISNEKTWGTVHIRESNDDYFSGPALEYYHGKWCDRNRNEIDEYPEAINKLLSREIDKYTTNGGWGCLDFNICLKPSKFKAEEPKKPIINIPDLHSYEVLKRITDEGIYYWNYKNNCLHCVPLVDIAGEKLVYSWDWLDMSGRDTGSMTFLFENYGKKENGGWALTEEELTEDEEDEPEEDDAQIITECKMNGNPEKICVKKVYYGDRYVDLGEGVFINKDFHTDAGGMFNIIEALVKAYENK